VSSDIVTLVAVRLNSTRLPRKALAELAGRPLIMRLTERVSQAALPAQVIWCTSTNTEDDPLEALSQDCEAWIYRGDELDVLSRFIEVAWARSAHTVIRVTGDNPLTDPEMIDVMLRSHAEAGADYTYTEDLPCGTRAEVIEALALERCHELAEDPKASEYMTLMLRRPDHFKVLKVDPPRPELKRPELRLTCDTPEDLQLLQRLYEAFDGAPPPLSEIIGWLDAHPEVAALNRHIKPREIDPSINVRLRGD
jgi:spore coat polysaccharide biosynthesis protein SpsF